MNFANLKYVIEIQKWGSISTAAKKLFIAQPNLSKLVKEMEQELGIAIFQRTAKGVVATRDGQRFLQNACAIQAQLDNLVSTYQQSTESSLTLKISVPRASYITHAFGQYTSVLDKESIRIHYHETSSFHTMQNVVDSHYDFGIVRYEFSHEEYYFSLFKLKNICYRKLFEYEYQLLTSKEGCLSKRNITSYKDLEDCMEIVHGDKILPTGDYVDLMGKKNDVRGKKKVIYVYERGSQLELLSKAHNTYMWVSPMPAEVLNRYGLMQRSCNMLSKPVKDVLIWRSDHNFIPEEELLLENIYQGIENVMKNLNHKLEEFEEYITE